MASMATPREEEPAQSVKGSAGNSSTEGQEGELVAEPPTKGFKRITRFLASYGIETHGIDPIPYEDRTDPRIHQMFFVWFSANFNVLAFSTGTAGPAFYGLGLRDTFTIIVITDVICCAIPAYFALFGPKAGLRAMVQARYAWGYYLAGIPSLLNVISMEGFLILNTIIGGQTLAAVNDNLSWTVGIVIIAVISLAVTFCGYQALHWYERIAWIPNAVLAIVMLSMGAKHLNNSAPDAVPATPRNVLSFITFLASSVISWSPMVADYGVYHSAKARKLKIFAFVYLGFFCASITWHLIGAAFAANAPLIPEWNARFAGGDIGGLMAVVLEPVGGFGKFMIVLVSLSVPSACAPTMYTFASSLSTVSVYFTRIPRYVYTVLSFAILIPLAIIGAHHFYNTLTNLLSVIGYWSTCFAAIGLVEHFVFRKGSFAEYDITTWNQPRRLPPGIAALFSMCCAFALIIPCMDQAWYTGPIADAGSGDIGVEVGAFISGLTYLITRSIELRFFNKHSLHTEDVKVPDV